MTTPLIESIRHAWREALREFIALSPVGEKSLVGNLLEVITSIRTHQLLREGKPESIVRRVFNDVRNVLDFYLIVMSVATTFKSQIEDYEAAISHLTNSFNLYAEDSSVVDKATLQKRAPNGAINGILSDNHWLVMLFAASLHSRDTLTVLLESGYDLRAIKK